MAAPSPPPLPTPRGAVEVLLLDGGNMVVTEDIFHAGAPKRPYRLYDWVFYIHDPQTGRRVIWDVGVGEKHEYVPFIQALTFPLFKPTPPRRSLVEQLAAHGVAGADIDTVVFSHAHWDHARPVSHLFPNATCYFGPGTAAFCAPGHLPGPDASTVDDRSQWDGRFFSPARACVSERWRELDEGDAWAPFGPFARARDLLGNGALWIVQTPGHLPGHLCAAAHVGDGQWVLMGGDCCHTRPLLDGVKEVAVYDPPILGGYTSQYHDLPEARRTWAKVRELEREYGVHVALAHDDTWMKKGEDAVLMGLLDGEMRAFVERGEGEGDGGLRGGGIP